MLSTRRVALQFPAFSFVIAGFFLADLKWQKSTASMAWIQTLTSMVMVTCLAHFHPWSKVLNLYSDPHQRKSRFGFGLENWTYECLASLDYTKELILLTMFNALICFINLLEVHICLSITRVWSLAFVLHLVELSVASCLLLPGASRAAQERSCSIRNDALNLSILLQRFSDYLGFNAGLTCPRICWIYQDTWLNSGGSA